MAAYADVAAVQARAGSLSAAWTVSSKPSTSDIQGFLDEISALIDAYLQARGLAPPAAGSAAANALKGVNADGALVLALEATFPEASGPASAGELLDLARGRYEKAMDALASGDAPAMMLLEAGSTTVPGASTFFEQEGSTYGLPLGLPNVPPRYPNERPEDQNPNTAPAVVRNMSF